MKSVGHAGMWVEAVVVMGVSGCGKTTVGQALAERWGATFLEGDAFHPEANVLKMSGGQPLTDVDRAPWLDLLREQLQAGPPGARRVLACSALKRSYREKLARGPRPIHWIVLEVPEAELARRMTRRRGHFMPASLLNSQLETLEVPSPKEGRVIRVRGDQPLDAILHEVTCGLG